MTDFKRRLTIAAYKELLSKLTKQGLSKYQLELIAQLVHFCNWLRAENSQLTTELYQLQNIDMFNAPFEHEIQKNKEAVYKEKRLAYLKALKGKEHMPNFLPIIRSLDLTVEEAKRIMEEL